MSRNLSSYLRTHRRRGGLTQEELAALLGLQGGQIISRYESLARRPGLDTAFACEVIFDAALRDLFPGLYDEVEILTLRRMRRLLAELEARPTRPLVTHKIDLLRDAIERVLRR